MSNISSAIRPFWVPGLNAISGRLKYNLSDWIIKQEYQIYTPLKKDECLLEISDKNKLLAAFAFDCNRMAIAAFESMHLISQSKSIPKSTSWLIIQSYYAAFFAAHSILRMFGISCSQFEQTQNTKIEEIADIYQNKNVIPLKQGSYQCTYNDNSKQLICKASSGGTHESFWKIFCCEMRNLSTNILSSNQPILQSQNVATKLEDMCSALCHEGKNGGNWLSYVRNIVNYRHELGSWFPYKKITKSCIDDLYCNYHTWLVDPMQITFVIKPGTDIQLFHNLCNFIVGVCRVLIQDMFNRCPTGNSYLADGSIRLLNTLLKTY